MTSKNQMINKNNIYLKFMNEAVKWEIINKDTLSEFYRKEKSKF